MKTFLLIPFTYLFCISSKTLAQELIPDPGFEVYWRLPEKTGNSIARTKHWMPASGNCDYYHRAADRHAGVPKNIFGRQKPHSGNAYGGMCIRKKFIEYVETKLSDTLIKDQDYLVEFYISRAERSLGAVKEFGVLFTAKTRWGLDDKGIKEKPDIEFIKKRGYRNKRKWTKLSAVYTANGNEAAVILGYFNHDKSKRFKGTAHYYIDDVSITPVETKKEEVVSVKTEEEVLAVPVSDAFSPNLGETITLKNIFFETNKSELLPQSFSELDKLVEFLQGDQSTTIEINGHTDNVGNENKNKVLSEARAKAVSDYLILKGIEEERVKYKGYGSEKPMTANVTEEDRQQNRRVEFIINKN